MASLTKEQRGEIYLKAAKKIFYSPTYKYVYCCHELMEAIGLSFFHDKFKSEYFPEFMLFKPETLTTSVWFNYAYTEETRQHENNMNRVVALLFACEMTKTENL